MKIFEEELIEQGCRACSIADIATATIGDMVLISQWLQKKTGIPVIRLDQGSPSLPQNRYGIEAEKAALDRGVGATYPAADGIAELKEATSEFLKAFVNIDISPRACLPVTGSVAGSFSSFIACTQAVPGKDKVLFIDPGFPIMKLQLKIIGVEWKSFDIYKYRGEALRARLEEELSSGDIAMISYSSPNNPAWFCLEESELRIIGELATKYDAVVLEDLAYFGMDYRCDLSHPYKSPYIPTVARYTDNYIITTSSSKIFSYAGQRIAVTCVSDKLFDRVYPALAERYSTPGVFGPTMVASIMYMITSGCTASAQYGYAAMMRLSCEGKINFIEDTREYSIRAEKMKRIFTSNGFRIVYDRDVTQEVGDGFFFTLEYPGLASGEMVREMLYYGISCISLRTTGSEQEGVRVCTSKMTEDMFPVLEERARLFNEDHKN